MPHVVLQGTPSLGQSISLRSQARDRLNCADGTNMLRPQSLHLRYVNCFDLDFPLFSPLSNKSLSYLLCLLYSFQMKPLPLFGQFSLKNHSTATSEHSESSDSSIDGKEDSCEDE
jgi:hypothetical protein